MRKYSLLSILFMGLAPLFLHSQEYYPQNFAAENGYIARLLKSNDTLFAAGSFYIGGYKLGSLIGYVGDDRTSLDVQVPFVDNGQVMDAVPDGNGGWYIATYGGISYGGETRRGVIHVNEDKSLDEDFPLMQTTSFGGLIYVLHLHNDILYVGGSFNEYAGVTKPQLLAYNTLTGQILDDWNTGLVYGSTQYVKALAVHDNKLIVGGELSAFAGQSVNNAGVFDLANGAMLTNFNANALVTRIIIDEDTAYIGGRFSTVSGVTRNGLVKINLTDNSQLPIGASFNSYVEDFKISGDDLYAGGWFTQVNGVARTGIVKMNRFSGEVNLDFNVNLDQARVACLDIVNENLIFGGNYMQVNGMAREKLAQVDKNTGALNPWNSSVASIPEGIKNVNGNLVIYGNMDQLQRAIRNSFFALKLPERTVLPIGFDEAPFSLSFPDIAKQGNKLYFAGSGALINGVNAGLLFSFDLLTQEIVSIGTFGGIPNATVDRLLIHEGKLYVNGYFLEVNGQARNRLARINLSDNTLDDWNPEPAYSFAARNMVVHNGKLFIAGSINQTLTTTQYVACALNLSDASWAGGLLKQPTIEQDFSGNDILIDGGNIYLAGSQRITFSPLVRSAILKLNEQFEYDPIFVAQMSENTEGSESLGMINGVLFAMHRVNQETRNIIFHSPLNGDSLLTLNVDFTGSAPFIGPVNIPSSYLFSDDFLFIGGNWDRVNFNTVRGLAIIDGRTVPFPDLATVNPETTSFTNNELLIYPNPNVGNFTVRWNKSVNHNEQLEVLDITGRILFSKHIPSGTQQMEVETSGLSAGMYFLRINGRNSQCKTFIVKP